VASPPIRAAIGSNGSFAATAVDRELVDSLDRTIAVRWWQQSFDPIHTVTNLCLRSLPPEVKYCRSAVAAITVSHAKPRGAAEAQPQSGFRAPVVPDRRLLQEVGVDDAAIDIKRSRQIINYLIAIGEAGIACWRAPFEFQAGGVEPEGASILNGFQGKHGQRGRRQHDCALAIAVYRDRAERGALTVFIAHDAVKLPAFEWRL
jgi:hypothetical protein